VALIAAQPFVIVGRKTLPADNLSSLIAWLKASATPATQGNAGVGSPSHISGVFFQKAIGAQLQVVPYRSAGLATQDILAGQIDMMLDTPVAALPLIRAGSIKGYAVTAKTRLATAPEIPTTDEAGLSGFYFSFWHAIWVPKSTPKEIIAKLNQAVVKTLADPATRQRLEAIAQEIFPSDQLTPEALGRYQKAEVEKWWPVIKSANIRAQ
jgi:tripartite-type tricarboxylate transporter receptor subunit TctC